MSKLLIDESPLQVLPSLAVLIGLNEAIALQQIHFRTRDKKDGWCYDSYETWRKDHFPFWSAITIRRIFKSLLDKDLISTEKQHTHGKGDHRLSVKVNHEALLELTARPDQIDQGSDQIDHGSDQNDHIYIHREPPESPHRTNSPLSLQPEENTKTDILQIKTEFLSLAKGKRRWEARETKTAKKLLMHFPLQEILENLRVLHRETMAHSGQYGWTYSMQKLDYKWDDIQSVKEADLAERERLKRLVGYAT